MLRFLLQALVVLVVFIAAWRTGGKPERYVASIYFAMLSIASLHVAVAPPVGPGSIAEFHQVRAWLDVAALAAVVTVALCYDRWWTLWVGSVQFIAVMAHVLRALDMPIPPIAHAVMERWPVWMAVFLTGLGTIRHYQRTKARLIGT
jgi:hypothetical protein